MGEADAAESTQADVRCAPLAPRKRQRHRGYLHAPIVRLGARSYCFDSFPFVLRCCVVRVPQRVAETCKGMLFLPAGLTRRW